MTLDEPPGFGQETEQTDEEEEEEDTGTGVVWFFTHDMKTSKLLFKISLMG